MPVKIKPYRGPKSTMPTLSSGELGWATDTDELFVGGSTGNKRVYPASWDEITDKPSTFPPSAHTHPPSDVTPQGHNSGLNADQLDGYHASTTPSTNTIPVSPSTPSGNQLLGVNSTGSAFEYKTIQGTTNQINVIHGTGTITLSAPQDLHTSATPTFQRLTLTQSTGTAPLTISSTTLVSNLNADLLDGYHISNIMTQSTQTIYVDADNGSDTTGDGSQSAPYRTIQKAFNSLPPILNHNVTIQLKAAQNTYSDATLHGRVAGTSEATLTIQGEMITLDSGTVSQVLSNVDDPTYGSLIKIDAIVDTSKNWTTNAFVDKILKVTKGSTIQYRVIVANTSNTIYVAQRFNPSIDNTWTYEVLDWGCEVTSTLSVDYNRLPNFNFCFLKFNPTSSYAFHSQGTMGNFYFYQCCFIKNVVNTHSIYKAYFYGADHFTHCVFINNVSSGYDAIHYSLSTFTCLLLGTVIKGYRNGIWVHQSTCLFSMFAGSRILHNNNSVATNGFWFNASRVSCFFYDPNSTPTDVLVDTPYLLNNSSVLVFTETSRLKLSSTTSPYSSFDIKNYPTGEFIINNGLVVRTTTVSSNTTLGSGHYIVFVDASGGSRTITLPSASSLRGRQYIIKKIDSSSNAVIISPQSGQTIDGQSSLSLTTQYECVTIVSDGTNWQIITR